MTSILPVDSRAAATRSASVSSAKTVSRKTILLIEEDESSRQLTSAFLREAGYRVLVAPEPGEGLALLDAFLDLDLIILDLKLATEGGPLLIEFLTCNRPTLPILLYTGAALSDSALGQARALGINRCLQKGAASDLIEATRQALEGV